MEKSLWSIAPGDVLTAKSDQEENHYVNKTKCSFFLLADNLGYGDVGCNGSGSDMGGMPTHKIDKLASEGEDMINLGTLANPCIDLDTYTGEEYAIMTLNNQDISFIVNIDTQGSVWVIVGTDSGFE